MRYILPSEVSSIATLERILIELSEKFSIPKDRYGDILISLTEAVNNAICHGNKYDRKKKVKIISSRIDDKILFQIKDEGAGFSPSKVKDPLCNDRLETPGGRGLLLINSLSDNVEFLDNGRTVELIFHLHSCG